MILALEQLKSKVKVMMEDEEIVLLFDLIREDLAKSMLRTKPNECELREELYLQSHGVTLLERKLTAIADELSEEK